MERLSWNLDRENMACSNYLLKIITGSSLLLFQHRIKFKLEWIDSIAYQIRSLKKE